MHAVVSDDNLDNLQKVRCILLPSTEFLWEHKLENSAVFISQTPLFPNNILKIASFLPSNLISQRGVLGLQKSKGRSDLRVEEAAGRCIAAELGS